MPVHRTTGGWKFGTSGKTYKKKSDAMKQARAIYANKWKEK